MADKPGDACYAAMKALMYARKRVTSALGDMQAMGLAEIEARMRRAEVARTILDTCRREKGYHPVVYCEKQKNTHSWETSQLWVDFDVYDPDGVVPKHTIMTNATASEANANRLRNCKVFYLAVHQAASAQEE